MGEAGVEGTDTENLNRKTKEMNPKMPKIPPPPKNKQEKPHVHRAYSQPTESKYNQALLPFTMAF